MPPTARLIIADSENCSDLYWATRFVVPDPIWFIEHRGKKILVASDLEYGRAKKEAEVDQVLSYSRYAQRLKSAGKKLTDLDVIDSILRERRIKKITVPASFPFRQAQGLMKKGYSVTAAADLFFPEREIKSAEERRYIIKSLRTTEAAIRLAIETIRRAKVRSQRLFFQGELLTSERLRRMMELKMMELGCLGRHTIVACGKQAADPHCVGKGPLYAGQTIVLDVFPKSIETGYYGDITRTVIKGKASEKLKRMYEAVRKAQAAGISLIRDGVDAAKVHREVERVLESSGFKTFVKNGKPQGFIHSTGHGLGLDIHESPRVSRLPNILKKGQVVTVEPGLYYENLGGIRIEDVVSVTKKGCDLLTTLPRQFIIV